MTSTTTPELSPSDFPVHAPCPPAQDWYQTLFRALREPLQIDRRFEPGVGGGYHGAGNPPWAGIEGELLGGIRVVGIKKRPRADRIQVEYALFAPDGRVVAWSGNLSPSSSSPALDITYRDDVGELAIDASMKARIKALTPKAAKPSKAKPFEAEKNLRAVALTEDGSRLAGVDAGGHLYVWEGASGALLAKAKAGAGGMKSIHEIAFSPDGARLAAGAGALTIFDVATGKPALKLAGHPKGEVWGLRFSPSGRFLASASRWPSRIDNSVALWDAATGEPLDKWPFDDAGATCTWLAFSPDESSLVFTTELQRPGVHRIDMASRTIAARWDAGAPCSGLARLHDGWCVVVGGEVLVLDPVTLAPLRRFAFPHASTARPWLAATPDGMHLVTSAFDVAKLMDASTGEVLRVLPTPDGVAACTSVAIAGSRAVGATGAVATIWSLAEPHGDEARQRR